MAGYGVHYRLYRHSITKGEQLVEEIKVVECKQCFALIIEEQEQAHIDNAHPEPEPYNGD